MTKLHELLAAEKTPTAAWNQLADETLKKFGKQSEYFEGYTKSLSMIEGGEASAAEEAKALEVKALPTTVYDTLAYALDIFAKAEDIQLQKNSTNQKATADVMFREKVVFTGLPVDELLGLEARLQKIRQIFVSMPTLDASKHWKQNPTLGAHIWETQYPEVTTKTKKVMTPVVLHAATDKHPAQVQAVNEDIVVGRYTTVRRSGAATAHQKAEAIKCIDELITEVKRARMRANEVPVVNVKIGEQLSKLLLEALK